VSADAAPPDVVFLDLPPDDSPDALPGVQAAISQPAGMTVSVAGGPAFYGDVQSVSESDLRRSEIVSLPLAALALLLVFGSIVAAAVPLAVGGTAVVLALAVIFALASAGPMSVFVLNLATLLGLGLGVDYSLLMTSRFREELARRLGPEAEGDDATARTAREMAVEAAVRVTVATAAGRRSSSAPDGAAPPARARPLRVHDLRSVGIAGAIVVGLAVLAALTLLPAILAVVGPRIDALAIRPIRTSEEGDGRWARLARWVMDRPVAVLVPTLGLLLLLGLPFLQVNFNAPDASILPPSAPSRAAYDRLVEQFGEGDFAPLALAIRTTGPVTDPANVAALHEYSRRLAADPRIVRVKGLVDVDPRLTAAQYQLLYADPADRPTASSRRVSA
jgi:RND superfamily putative drug exporter